MKRMLSTASVIYLLAAPAAFAIEPEIGATLGTDPATISSSLGESGYELVRFEREDGRIEMTARGKDRRLELYVDAATGKVTSIEEDEARGPWRRSGSNDGAIREKLEAEGYEILEFEREHRRVEVLALRDGQRWELYVDPRDGDILEVERED